MRWGQDLTPCESFDQDAYITYIKNPMSTDQKYSKPHRTSTTSTTAITQRLTTNTSVEEKKYPVKEQKYPAITSSPIPSKKEIISFLQCKDTTFSEYSSWLKKCSSPEDTLQALADTLRSLHDHLSDIIEIEKLPAFIDHINQQFIAILTNVHPQSSPPLVAIFIATNILLTALDDLTQTLLSQKKAGNTKVKPLTIPLIELLTVLLNLINNTNTKTPVVLTTRLCTSQLLTLCTYLKSQQEGSPTLDDLGELLGIMGGLLERTMPDHSSTSRCPIYYPAIARSCRILRHPKPRRLAAGLQGAG